MRVTSCIDRRKMSRRGSRIVGESILACERVSEGVVIAFAESGVIPLRRGLPYQSREAHDQHVPNSRTMRNVGPGHRETVRSGSTDDPLPLP